MFTLTLVQVLLGISLLSQQVICFAPNRLQSTQLKGRYISTTLRVDNLLEEQQATLDINNDSTIDYNSGEECVFQDIEVGCLDPIIEEEEVTTSWSYKEFAKTYPNVNNIAIATIKTGSADLLAQVVIGHTPIANIDWDRSLLFCTFGALYMGGFQYWYQVNIFKKLFDVEKFTSLSWEDKAKDTDGLIKSLAAQTVVDLTVLTLVYLPTFYVFKSSVFSGSSDPSVWFKTGIDNYTHNFSKDEFDLLRVWLPADLVCFSVPLYLRLPVRHIVSFVWTAYLSFSRGGH